MDQSTGGINFLDIIKKGGERKPIAKIGRNVTPNYSSDTRQDNNINSNGREKDINLNHFPLNSAGIQRQKSRESSLSSSINTVKRTNSRPSISFNEDLPLEQPGVRQRNPGQRSTSPYKASPSPRPKLREGSSTTPASSRPRKHIDINQGLTNGEIPTVWVVVGGCLGLLLLYSIGKYLLTPPFCSLYEDPSTKWCKPCPDLGNCEDGALASCQNPYVPIGGQCVPDEEIGQLAEDTFRYIATFLTRQLGMKHCDKNIQTEFTKREILELLREQFPSQRQKIDEKLAYIQDRWNKLVHKYPVTIFRNVFVATGEEIPLICKMQITYYQYRKTLIMTVVVIALLLILKYFYTHKKWYLQQAEELAANRGMALEELMSKYRTGYTKHQFKGIWTLVEGLRLNEQVIYIYEDQCDGLPEQIWVLEEHLKAY